VCHPATRVCHPDTTTPSARGDTCYETPSFPTDAAGIGSCGRERSTRHSLPQLLRRPLP
jgi:hypothetical protein